jgi:hypothetical protein
MHSPIGFFVEENDRRNAMPPLQFGGDVRPDHTRPDHQKVTGSHGLGSSGKGFQSLRMRIGQHFEIPQDSLRRHPEKSAGLQQKGLTILS